MSFQEAREIHLREFDRRVLTLRGYISDPTHCNDENPEIKRAFKSIGEAAEDAIRLNRVQQQAACLQSP